MKPEGMVHALEEIHRLLRPTGSLLDIHPFPEPLRVEVHQGGQIPFSEPSPHDHSQVYGRAEVALEEVVSRNLFRVEDSREIEFMTYGASVGELLEFLETISGFDEGPEDEESVARDNERYARIEQVRLAAGEGAQVATHERARITYMRRAQP